jgi:hypothetical protein
VIGLLWDRKSQEWEAELAALDAERAWLGQPRTPILATAAQTLELAKQDSHFRCSSHIDDDRPATRNSRADEVFDNRIFR